MLHCRAFFIAASLLLLAHTGRAQGRPAAAGAAAGTDSLHQRVNIHIALPKSLGILRDCARILFSNRDSEEKLSALLDRRRQKTAKPEVDATLMVPKNRLTKALHLVD